jgi:hypothetical protein
LSCQDGVFWISATSKAQFLAVGRRVPAISRQRQR